jgi:hypothetical protein
MDVANISRSALNDVGEVAPGLTFLDDSLHHVSAVGAPFRDLDKWVLFFELAGDVLKPRVRVVKNQLFFLLCASNENGLAIRALVEHQLRHGHGRIAGNSIRAREEQNGRRK